MNSKPVNILLADDDIDDRNFFKEAVAELQLPTLLRVFQDGEQLMQYLEDKANEMPDVLFLDLNMPRKNGFECLAEIKQDTRLKKIPVIMFSTSFEISVVNRLYEDGAQYFIRKPPEFSLFKMIILKSLALIVSGHARQPARKDFVIEALKESTFKI